MSFVCYGARIGIRGNDEVFVRCAAETLPIAARASRAHPDVAYRLTRLMRDGAPFFVVERPGASVVGSATIGVALERFESDVEFQIAMHARRRVFVHAAVVESGGRALLCPGRTHSGKSTLLAALVDAGATYYSDEFAVIDARGRVHAFPRPVSLRDGRSSFPVEDRPRPPIPVGLILSTRFESGASEAFEPRSPAIGLLALMSNTVVVRRRPRLTMRALSTAVAGATVLEGPRGEAGPAARTLLERMADVEHGPE